MEGDVQELFAANSPRVRNKKSSDLAPDDRSYRTLQVVTPSEGAKRQKLLASIVEAKSFYPC
jgi:hypothetical protein